MDISEYPCFKKKKKNLPLKIYIAYGLGHILNDIVIAMWFSYLIVFFHLVLGFENSEAGTLLLIGQVADAVATPFIGYNSDKDRDWWIYRCGKRKAWYFLGTLCVIFTVPFIFSPCVGCQSAFRFGQMLYYSFFIVVFQAGWASVQISHMALIPEITSSEYQRTKLSAVRNGATVVASIVVYLVTWGILHMSGGSQNKIGPEDASRFYNIVLSVMSLGTVCSIVFFIIIKEPAKKVESVKDAVPQASFKELFLNYNLYLVGMVYMSSRVFINLTQVFITLYLTESLNMVASYLALIPLVMYIASFVASIPVGPMAKRVGRKNTYLIGVTIGLAACFWIQWGQGTDYKNYFIFVVSVLLGSASTIVLVSSLDISTNLIGCNTCQGAFIYSVVSFPDKLINGVAVDVIQDIHTDGNINFYRNILSYVCGGALALGALAVVGVNINNTKTEKLRAPSIKTIS